MSSSNSSFWCFHLYMYQTYFNNFILNVIMIIGSILQNSWIMWAKLFKIMFQIYLISKKSHKEA